jgi:hypothetical protein
VTGTRWLLPLVAGLAVAGPAGAGMFDRKPKTAAQVKRLADSLRADPDERRRRAAVAELREADPRVLPDVIPALVGVLQRDPSAAVRADAAEAIGSFKTAFPVAGAALEAAAEADPSAAVRGAAQQALWEYHLNGYRSLKGADGIAGQTAEPPLARRPPRPPAPEVAPPAPGSAVVSLKPGSAAEPLPRAVAPRVVFTTAPPLVLDGTPEPPLAERPPKPIPPPMGLVPERPRAAPPRPKPVPPPAGLVPTLPPGLPTIPAIPGSLPPGP